MNLHIDLGQIIISALIAVVGYFIRKEITTFGERLDKHEETIFTMAQNVSQVIGQVGILNKLIGIDSAIIELHRVTSQMSKNEPRP